MCLGGKEDCVRTDTHEFMKSQKGFPKNSTYERHACNFTPSKAELRRSPAEPQAAPSVTRASSGVLQAVTRIQAT